MQSVLVGDVRLREHVCDATEACAYSGQAGQLFRPEADQAFRSKPITYGYEAGTSRLTSLTWQADGLAQCGGPQVAVTRGVSRDGLGRATSGYGVKYPLASDEYLVSYDAAGQLATAASGGAGLYEYGYDHRRLRVRKTGPEGSVRYVYDEGGRLLSEADGSGTREYVWLGGEALVLLEDVDNDPSTPSVAYLLATDQLGTPVRAYEASSGEAAWAADHEPFGRAWTYVPGSVQGPGLEVSLRYPGHVADAETGLHYNWHRYYDPETGRYLQPEPLATMVPGWGQPVYSYALNSPVCYVDRNGLFVEPGSGTIGGIVIGFGWATTGAAVGAFVVGAAIGTGINHFIGPGIQDLLTPLLPPYNPPDNRRKRERSDPVDPTPPTDPGRGPGGGCNPCPPSVAWPGEDKCHWHWTEWDQDPVTCMCFEKRREGKEPPF